MNLKNFFYCKCSVVPICIENVINSNYLKVFKVSKMVTCSAYGCTNSTKLPKKGVYGCINASNLSKKGMSFFSFPTNPQRRELWVQAVGRSNWTPSHTARLCQVHFREEDLDRTAFNGYLRLRENVVPSIFPAIPSHLQLSAPVNESSPGKRQKTLLPLECSSPPAELCSSMEQSTSWSDENDVMPYHFLQVDIDTPRKVKLREELAEKSKEIENKDRTIVEQSRLIRRTQKKLNLMNRKVKMLQQRNKKLNKQIRSMKMKNKTKKNKFVFSEEP
uniref:THAP domain-containing protein 6 n=2 Tax=Cacopsylla melanoneura TaxID=428564 RepID=A0A8D8YBA4_9HEMI